MLQAHERGGILLIADHRALTVRAYDPPFDASSGGATDVKECITAESEAAVPYIKRPPSRLLLDRLIKEQVFDRNLSDAIIYTGLVWGGH